MRSPVRRSIACAAALALVGAFALGCNTYADSLGRAQRAFEQSEHERALAILRVLEPDLRRLTDSDRAKYCYLRGLTDYRIGYRLEARHWLSVAAAVVKETPDALPADWSKRLKESLKDLDEAVYTGGIASLSNNPAAAHKATAKDDDDDSEAAPAAPAKPAPPKATDE
jgi:hypothetical protein